MYQGLFVSSESSGFISGGFSRLPGTVQTQKSRSNSLVRRPNQLLRRLGMFEIDLMHWTGPNDEIETHCSWRVLTSQTLAIEGKRMK